MLNVFSVQKPEKDLGPQWRFWMAPSWDDPRGLSHVHSSGGYLTPGVYTAESYASQAPDFSFSGLCQTDLNLGSAPVLGRPRFVRSIQCFFFLLRVSTIRCTHGTTSLGPVHTGHVSRFARKFANPLMLLATCVNTPIYCSSVFHNLQCERVTASV